MATAGSRRQTPRSRRCRGTGQPRRHLPFCDPYFVTCTAEKDLIARIESLISELAGVGEVDGELERRRLETLMEGYGRALALEGQRRRLRERQVELADAPEPDAVALSELGALALHEARLGRREGKLRAMLARLREGERGGKRGASKRSANCV
jgi:hypothetical protein